MLVGEASQEKAEGKRHNIIIYQFNFYCFSLNNSSIDIHLLKNFTHTVGLYSTHAFIPELLAARGRRFARRWVERCGLRAGLWTARPSGWTESPSRRRGNPRQSLQLHKKINTFTNLTFVKQIFAKDNSKKGQSNSVRCSRIWTIFNRLYRYIKVPFGIKYYKYKQFNLGIKKKIG